MYGMGHVMTRDPVAIVTAADDAFGWPAALALLSADANASGRTVKLILIDCGISADDTAPA
jgi:hypothetical protein